MGNTYIGVFITLSYLFIILHFTITLWKLLNHRTKVSYIIGEFIIVNNKNLKLIMHSSLINIVFMVVAIYSYWITKNVNLNFYMVIFCVINTWLTKSKLRQFKDLDV